MNAPTALLHPGLESVLATALDAVVVMDADGRIRGWNAVARQIFGWTAAEAIGQRLSALIIPERYREQHERGLAHFLATGEGPVLDRHIEVTGCTRDRGEIPVELSITSTDQFGATLFVGFLRDIGERQRQAEQRERLLRELNHRVKNTLSLVASIAFLTARNSADLKQFMTAFDGRLQSMAASHDLLVSTDWGETELRSLAQHVLGADAASGRAEIGGPVVVLESSQVIGLAMIFHELYTNAAKYGALHTPGGKVRLHWQIGEPDQVVVDWTETGVQGLEPPAATGFGQTMIELSCKHDLGGVLEREWRPDGLRVTLRFPLANQASGSA